MTLIPCRAASLATTNRPIRSVPARSNSGGLASWALSSSMTAWLRPRPRSSTSTREAVGRGQAADVHDGVRRGEDGGVLHQLGDQVDHVGHRAAHQQRGLRIGEHRDPGVVLDLQTALRTTSKIGTGSRQRRPGAASDRMIRFSACRRMRVVRWSSLNRSSSDVRIFDLALHRVEQAELAVQQGLVAPGEVEEDLADALAQRGLADRGLYGGAPYGGERPHDPVDLGGVRRVQLRGLGAGSTSSPLRSRSTSRGSRPRPVPRRTPGAASARRSGSGRTGRRARIDSDDGEQAEPHDQPDPQQAADSRLSPLPWRGAVLPALPVEVGERGLGVRASTGAASTGGFPVRSQAKILFSAAGSRW